MLFRTERRWLVLVVGCFVLMASFSSAGERFQAAQSFVGTLDHMRKANCILGFSKPLAGEQRLSLPGFENKLRTVIGEYQQAHAQMLPYLKSQDQEVVQASTYITDYLLSLKQDFEGHLKALQNAKSANQKAGKKVDDAAIWRKYRTDLSPQLADLYGQLETSLTLAKARLQLSNFIEPLISQEESQLLALRITKRYGSKNSKNFQRTDVEKEIHYFREILESQ